GCGETVDLASADRSVSCERFSVTAMFVATRYPLCNSRCSLLVARCQRSLRWSSISWQSCQRERARCALPCSANHCMYSSTRVCSGVRVVRLWISRILGLACVCSLVCVRWACLFVLGLPARAFVLSLSASQCWPSALRFHSFHQCPIIHGMSSRVALLMSSL